MAMFGFFVLERRHDALHRCVVDAAAEESSTLSVTWPSLAASVETAPLGAALSAVPVDHAPGVHPDSA